MNIYALCMIFAAGSLLTLLCVAIYEWWRDKRDAETDAMLRKGMAEAYKRGLIASGARPEFYRITKRVSK